MIPEFNPYLPPQSALLPEGIGIGAPLGHRAGAALVDSLLLAAAILGVSWATGGLGWLLAALLPGIRIPFRVTGIALSCFVLIQGIPLHTRGQTVGKWLFGLRVADFKGQRAPSWILILWRPTVTAFLLHLPLVGLLAWAVDALFCLRPDRRCLHDWLTETQVLQVSDSPAVESCQHG